jgi:hypothetical protein
MLGRTQKSVQYVPNSIGMLIVADGINVSMQMNTSFTTPVWAGACAGGLIVKDPQQYPQILSALFNASAQLEQVVAAGIPTESQFVTCGLSYFVCGGNDTINGLCDPPVVTISPQNQSLVARANPASPKDSYIVTMNVSVTMKVQMGGEADVPVTSTCLTIVSELYMQRIWEGVFSFAEASFDTHRGRNCVSGVWCFRFHVACRPRPAAGSSMRLCLPSSKLPS